MKAIRLASGDHAWVEDADFELVSKRKWHVDGRGYVITRNRHGSHRETILLHRYILGISDYHVQVDHVDHDKLNNLRSNLRVCNNSQNQANKVSYRDAFKGVYWRPSKKAFVAEITCNRKRHYLGFFRKEIDAAIAYNKKALELFGEFALLNKVKTQVSQPEFFSFVEEL